jgi:hypothetical protein
LPRLLEIRAAMTGALTLAAVLTACTWVEPPTESHASQSQWRALSRQLASPWPRIQRRDGSLPDVLRGGRNARYGNGIAGLGLLQAGLRGHDRRMVRAGLRAVSVQTRRLRDPAGLQEFRVWAVAEAYSLARNRLGHWPSARRASRHWARWLRHARIWWLRMPGYENKVLVEAVATLELLRTGLHSRIKGAALGRARGTAWKLVLRLINRRIPAMVRRRWFLLSDPGPNPPAYHALSYAMYARAVRLLGPRASRRAHAVLRKLAWTTERMTAPSGDVAYWGRSQGMVWTLSSAAYGLAATARERGLSRAARRRYRAVADRLLTRLGSYGSGPRGEWIVPAIRQDPSARAALDHYAHAPEYTGLALVYLNWAVPLMPRRSTAGAIPADGPLRTVIGQGRARFAVVRQGDLWYAVRERGTGSFRYDFGLIAAKRRDAGTWRDILPLRPPSHSSTGPVLRLGKRHGHAVGTSMRVTPEGRVLIRGGFRSRHRWLRRGVQFVVEPTSCGPQLLLSARPGDRYNFTAFFRQGEHRSGTNYRAVGDQVVSFSEPLTSVRFTRSRPSPSDAHLTRARFSLRASTSGFVAFSMC